MTSFVDTYANYMAAGTPFVDAIMPMVLWFGGFVIGFAVIKWAISAVRSSSTGGSVRFPTGGDTRKGG